MLSLQVTCVTCNKVARFEGLVCRQRGDSFRAERVARTKAFKVGWRGDKTQYCNDCWAEKGTK